VGADRGSAMGNFTAASDLGVGLGAEVMGVVLRFTNHPVMVLSLALVAVMRVGYFHYFMKSRNKGLDKRIGSHG
jgi:predicted MFS family arabinose efflux permease